VYNTYTDQGKPTQRRGAIGAWISGDVLKGLHYIFNTITFPDRDLWSRFGFENAPVQVAGTLYQCKALPVNGWCSLMGYKPGFDIAWKDALDIVDVCNAGVIPGSKPTNDC
jgi:hypothetical protein